VKQQINPTPGNSSPRQAADMGSAVLAVMATPPANNSNPSPTSVGDALNTVLIKSLEQMQTLHHVRDEGEVFIR
jgi:hypothetical protein